MPRDGATCFGCLRAAKVPKAEEVASVQEEEPNLLQKEESAWLPFPDEAEEVLDFNASLGTRFFILNEGVESVGSDATSPDLGPRNFSLLATSVDSAEEGSEFIAQNLDLSPPVTADKKSPPNFTGHWKMTRCEGDFDSFLKEMGIGWAFRRAASAAGYGAGNTYHTIKQNDNVFSVTTTNPKGIFEKHFVVDGTEQDEKDPSDGSALRIVPVWDGNVLHIDTRKVSPAQVMPVTRRYFSGKEMIMEQTSPQGVIVKRFFELHEK